MHGLVSLSVVVGCVDAVSHHGGESTFIGDDHHWRSGYNKVINAGLNRVNESRTAQGTQHPSPPTHHACRNHHDGTLCSPIYSGSLLYCTRMFVFIHLRDVGRLQTAVQSQVVMFVDGQRTSDGRAGDRKQGTKQVQSPFFFNKGQPRDNSWTLPPPPPPKLEGEPTDRRQTRVDEHHRTNQSQVVSQQVASRSASYKIRGDGDVDRVTWAVLTIYEGEGEEVEGWVEKEKIVLSELETKEEMHALMVDKGFELRSEEEIAERKAEKEKEEKELAEMRKRRQAASQEARRKKQKEQRVDDLKDKDEL
eukprot:scaffold2615_cov199-Alexandrium_tamarense.AAC.3